MRTSIAVLLAFLYPTLVSLGFEWRIDGDDNRNAQVTVSYRKAGEQIRRAGDFIRNVVYHAPEGGAVKFTASSSGIVVVHNTFVAPVKPMLLAASNVHYRNNLILGKSETLETFAVETNTNYSSSDYNGFRPFRLNLAL